jgi:hypothetical protein
MRARATATLVAALALALAAPLAGCGKDKPKIPRADARELVTLLEQAQRRAEKNPCGVSLTQLTLPELQSRVAALPSRTDSDIRVTLRDGVDQLRELVAAQCAQEKPKKPKETTTESTESQPSTQTDTTTDTQTDTNTDTETDTNTDTNTEPVPPTDTTPTTPSGGTPPGQQKKHREKKKAKRK